MDVSQHYLSLTSLDGERQGVYNAEGVAYFAGDIYVVNDNQPGNGVGSYLMRWANVAVDEHTCTLAQR
jgi:hypothetical protein